MVDALGTVAADLSALGTLVDVLARAVGLRAVALGTGAVTDSTSDFDALGSVRTLFSSRAVGQYALSVDDLVRRLALALYAVTLCGRNKR